MTSQQAELSRNMDRITQLQDGIDGLVTIMFSTLSFLTRKAEFRQVNPDIPITQTIPRPEGTKPSQETFHENCAELVQDFLKKAKQIEYLISILPPHEDSVEKEEEKSRGINQKENSSSTNKSNKKEVKTKMRQENEVLNDETKEPASISLKQETDDNQDILLKDPDNDDDSVEFERLQADIHAAQHEYDQALLDAESLRTEIKEALDRILDRRMKLLTADLL